MLRPKISATSLAALALTAACATAQPKSIADELAQGNVQRILFLGDSITYDGRYVTNFESWLLTRYSERDIEVIDVGLSSETVSGLTEEGHADGKFDRPYLMDRLESVLEKTDPDLVFACYGMNCGVYKPFDEDRFARYRDGITTLHDTVVKRGARVVHVTPPVYDAEYASSHVAAYDAVLARYGEWLLSKRAGGWEVIDLHGPMANEVQRRRERDPKFTFAQDGVHPGDDGHWFMAQQFIAYCGDAKAASLRSVQELLGQHAPLLPVISERMSLMRDAWLTYTGHNHPYVPPGVPMDEARAKREEITARIKSEIGAAK
ncbi:MAG: SGNH/GDSL hydrolase family protein [Candidatus Hydrogenedentes bacterium]|nr:SGNH/GDSL hydrolase family protein [Candidatus Hydrogenedentota bacterium]